MILSLLFDLFVNVIFVNCISIYMYYMYTYNTFICNIIRLKLYNYYVMNLWCYCIILYKYDQTIYIYTCLFI